MISYEQSMPFIMYLSLVRAGCEGIWSPGSLDSASEPHFSQGSANSGRIASNVSITQRRHIKEHKGTYWQQRAPSPDLNSWTSPPLRRHIGKRHLVCYHLLGISNRRTRKQGSKGLKPSGLQRPWWKANTHRSRMDIFFLVSLPPLPEGCLFK